MNAPASPRSAVTRRIADAALLVVLLQDRQARDLAAGGLGRLAGHAADGARVRAQVRDALLGAPQARGGDHLHRARDLADVLDRLDAVLDVALGGHGQALTAPASSARASSSPASPSAPSARRRRRARRARRRPRAWARRRRPAAGPPRRGRSRSRRRTRRSPTSAPPASRRTSRPSPTFSRRSAFSARMRCVRPSRNSPTRSALMRSRKPFVAAKTCTTCSSTGIGERSSWLSVATRRSPRASVRWVSASRSEPNWAKASRSRYCESSIFRRPATLLHRRDLRRCRPRATPRCRR